MRLLLLYSLLHSSVGFDCPSAGLHADPTDCSTYYRCSRDKVKLFSARCGTGLRWNDNMKKCDLEENVNCNRNQSTEDENHIQGNTNFNPAQHNFPAGIAPRSGVLPGAVNDQEEGNEDEDEDDEDEEDNDDEQEIDDYQEKDDHKARNIGRARVAFVPPKSDPEFDCTDKSGFHAHLTNCSAYYHCHEGKAYPGYCGENRYWDQRLEMCSSKSGDCTTAIAMRSFARNNPALNVPTRFGNGNGMAERARNIHAGRLSAKTAKMTKIDGPVLEAWLQNMVCKHDGHFPDPQSCQHFYSCSHGQKYQLVCATGTVWNQTKHRCDFPQQYPNCLTEGIGSSGILAKDISAAVNKTFVCTANYSPDPLNCRGFYRCANGKQYPMLCAPGTSWNPDKTMCNEDLNGDCPDSTTTTTEAPESTAGATHSNTSAMMHFTTTHTSTTPNTTGKTTTSRETASAPTDAPKIWFRSNAGLTTPVPAIEKTFECTQDGFFPDPTSCSSFYHCSMGQKFRFSCSQGTQWNQKKGFCDHADQVNCLDAGPDPTVMLRSFVPTASKPSATAAPTTAAPTTAATPSTTTFRVNFQKLFAEHFKGRPKRMVVEEKRNETEAQVHQVEADVGLEGVAPALNGAPVGLQKEAVQGVQEVAAVALEEEASALSAGEEQDEEAGEEDEIVENAREKEEDEKAATGSEDEEEEKEERVKELGEESTEEEQVKSEEKEETAVFTEQLFM